MRGVFNPEKILAKYPQSLPRYTSYPPANHFQPAGGRDLREAFIAAVDGADAVSAYIHIPYCDCLCWFCGCHTKQTLRYDPVRSYVTSLIDEIALWKGRLTRRPRLSRLHLGGGSPSLLQPDDLKRLREALDTAFVIDGRTEISIELDPSDIKEGSIPALLAFGMTRASIGVQDFDPEVQRAINRFQSFEETRAVAEGLRQRGVNSLNVDLLYGLPHQNPAAMLKSLDQVLTLRPDRLALFGYAHVPWMKKHQEMIPTEALPGMPERIECAERATGTLMEAGYTRIGLDHFALPTDSLAIAAATGTLRRNFQGYTTDDSDCLIGLGASSIGQFPQGFVQNETGGQAYERRVKEIGLSVSRGLATTAEDRLRADAIEDLMCNLRLDLAQLRARHGALVDMLVPEMTGLLAEEPADWFEKKEAGFAVTEAGRPFLRLIAARFDAYLARGTGRHSSAM